MGLFSFFSKKHDVYERSIIEIAKLISGGDKAVVREMRICCSDVKRYASHHSIQYLNRGIDAESTDVHTLMWTGLADCLIKHGFAQEFDWKCEKDDFVEFMSRLKNFGALGCEINPVLLYDDDDVASWCAAQDKMWYTKQLCIGGIDIESDSYVLFVCSVETLSRMRSAALKIHRRIAFGREM